MNKFLKRKENKKCDCPARKNAVFSETFKVYETSDNIDVLLILEYPELETFNTYLIKEFKKHFKSFAIINGLGCKLSENNDTVNIYNYCKKFNIKQLIKDYKPKTIMTVGRAIYTITDSNIFSVTESIINPTLNSKKGGDFFALHEDDFWIYSSEFNCKVYPVANLLKTILFDNYEHRHFKDQIKRVIESLNDHIEEPKNVKFEIVKNENEFIKKLISDNSIKNIAMDIEAGGFNYYVEELYNLSISYDGITGYFLLFKNIDKQLLIELFNTDKNFIYQNGLFDLKFLIINGIYNAHCGFDTMLAAHMLNENSPNGLKPLSWLYTKHGGYDYDLKKLLKKYKLKSFLDLPKDILVEYACYDAIVTYQLFEYFVKRLNEESKEIQHNFYEYVMPAIESVIQMELNGLQIDIPYLNKYNNELVKKRKDIENVIYNKIGKEFNLNSNVEVSNIIKSIPEFKKFKKDEILLTKKKDLQLNKVALNIYAKKGLWIAKLIIDYNHISKEISQLGLELKDKYKKKRTIFDNSKDNFERGLVGSIYKNRLYGGYKLHGTKPGRMSGGGGLDSSINYQNMPKDKLFRLIFLPEKDFVFVEIDYKGMEVVISSQISGKGKLEELILENKDMHCYTASEAVKTIGVDSIIDFLNDQYLMSDKLQKHYGKDFNKNILNVKSLIKDKVQKDFNMKSFLSKYDFDYDSLVLQAKHIKEPIFELFRALSKVLNFHCFYGGSDFGLSISWDIEKQIASKFINVFYEAYPEFKKYTQECKYLVTNFGYVETMLGRKRRLPKLQYPKCVMNDSISYPNKKAIRGELLSILSTLNNASVNARIQGTSGQYTIIKMNKINKMFKKYRVRSKMLANVHDSILFAMHISEIENLLPRTKTIMVTSEYENNGGNTLQHEVDITIGDTWGFGENWEYWKEHPDEWNALIKSINLRNDNNYNIGDNNGK